MMLNILLVVFILALLCTPFIVVRIIHRYADLSRKDYMTHQEVAVKSIVNQVKSHYDAGYEQRRQLLVNTTEILELLRAKSRHG